MSVILVVAVGDPANGVERLVDVLTGAGIALVFTQLLFPPEPLALLRRAEKATLTAIADGLAGTADAIAQDDEEGWCEHPQAGHSNATTAGKPPDRR